MLRRQPVRPRPEIDAGESQIGPQRGQRTEQLPPPAPTSTTASISGCWSRMLRHQLGDDVSAGRRGPEMLVGNVDPPEPRGAVRRFHPRVEPGCARAGAPGLGRPRMPRRGDRGSSPPPMGLPVRGIRGVVPPSKHAGACPPCCPTPRCFRRPPEPDRRPFPAVPPMPPLPQRLAAEPPGWVTEVDVVVIGSGIAGLTAALECRDLGQVMVVTKHVLEAGLDQLGARRDRLGPGGRRHRGPAHPGHPGGRRRTVRRGGGPRAGQRGAGRSGQADRPRSGVRPRRRG